jgi:hypothetical protein
MAASSIERRAINTIRVLAADMVRHCVADVVSLMFEGDSGTSNTMRPDYSNSLTRAGGKGQQRASRCPDGMRPHGAPALVEGHEVQPLQSQVAVAGPIRFVQWAQLCAALQHATRDWL